MIPVLEDIIRGLLNGTMTPEQAKFYLEQHEQLQAEVDALTDVPYARGLVTLDVLRKCIEQDERWGPRQYPSFDAGLVASADTGPFSIAGFYEVVNAKRARLLTDNQALNNELSWMTILVEELTKLTEKHEDVPALRAQLIDVAGVAVQWATQLTPEPQYSVEAVDNGDGTMGLSANVTLDGGVGAGGGGGYAEVHQEADHEGPNLR